MRGESEIGENPVQREQILDDAASSSSL